MADYEVELTASISFLVIVLTANLLVRGLAPSIMLDEYA